MYESNPRDEAGDDNTGGEATTMLQIGDRVTLHVDHCCPCFHPAGVQGRSGTIMSIATHRLLAADNAMSVAPRIRRALASFEEHIYVVALGHPESFGLYAAQELLLPQSGVGNALGLSTIAGVSRASSWAFVGSDGGIEVKGVLTRAWLTGQEWDVITASASGRTLDEVAVRLGQTPETIRFALASAMTKLGAHSKLEAVVIARRLGLIGPFEERPHDEVR